MYGRERQQKLSLGQWLEGPATEVWRGPGLQGGTTTHPGSQEEGGGKESKELKAQLKRERLLGAIESDSCPEEITLERMDARAPKGATRDPAAETGPPSVT